ncbi:MAG: hypothetical protein ACXWG3_04895 [Usitatibacter sp.]
MQLDPEVNGAAASRVKAWRIATDGEGVIARHTLALTEHAAIEDDVDA